MEPSSVYIGLSNPKSPENVASVLRAAGNFRVEHVLYTGVRYPRALARNPVIPQLSRKVSEGVAVSQVECLVDSVAADMNIVCVELAENAISLPVYEHPTRALYIFGPEDGSLSQALIDRAHAVIYVPTVGCMNLAATVNVVLYDRLAKMGRAEAGNDLIRKSRDTNNTVKVKTGHVRTFF